MQSSIYTDGTPRNALYRVSPDAAARALGGYSLMVLAE
jgi:hypothetical protein